MISVSQVSQLISVSSAEAPVSSEFLSLLRISEFFGFQWQKLAEILSLFKLYNNLGKVAVRVNFWLIIYCGHLVEWIVIVEKSSFQFTEFISIGQGLAWKWFTRLFCCESVNAAITRYFLSQMSHLRIFFVANIMITRFMGWNFWQNFGRNYQKYSFFSLLWI